MLLGWLGYGIKIVLSSPEGESGTMVCRSAQNRITITRYSEKGIGGFSTTGAVGPLGAAQNIFYFFLGKKLAPILFSFSCNSVENAKRPGLRKSNLTIFFQN